MIPYEHNSLLPESAKGSEWLQLQSPSDNLHSPPPALIAALSRYGGAAGCELSRVGRHCGSTLTTGAFVSTPWQLHAVSWERRL